MSKKKGTYRYKKDGKIYNIRIDRIVAVLVIVIVLIILLCSCIKSCSKSDDKKKTSTPDEKTTSENTETTDNSAEIQTSTEPALSAQVIKIPQDQLNCGDLIMIDGSHPYTFSENDTDIQTIASLKNDSYTTSDLVISLDSNVIEKMNTMMSDFNAQTSITDIRVISAYRSYDDQNERYSSGAASTAAGYSEYHSGRTFSLGIFPEGQNSTYYSPDYTSDNDYGWLAENADKYGFIQRYPEGKSEYTGEEEIKYVYRYVGVPHSVYIYENNLCLEEYLELVKSYTYESPLSITAGDVKYNVYYTAANQDGDTEAAVLAGADYTISGNNADGFIITEKNQ